ncbi:MAG TPA: sigma-70 family RNA polymerase sigma factor [Solirubrobacteraceae bacterium]|jgi:RNA polymerase sigma-70 factor (ECF subfamily)
MEVQRDPRTEARASRAGDAQLAALAEQARDGDDRAFSQLYAMLFGEVERWLRGVLKDREEAADAAQQVFLRAFEALPRYTERGGFRAWVFSIARNHAWDRLNAASRSTFAVAPEDLDRHERRGSAATGGSDAHEDLAAIERVIARLPAKQRRVLRLRFVFDMTAPEIARVLGISVDAVRHLQQRALRSLARSGRRDAVTSR